MSFGFDAIDKKFRRPEPIKLECARCGSTKDVATRRDLPDELVLCESCVTAERSRMWGYPF